MPLPPPNDRQKPYGAAKALNDLKVKESPVSDTPYVQDQRGNAAPGAGTAPKGASAAQAQVLDAETANKAVALRNLVDTYRQLAVLSAYPGASPAIIAQKDAAYGAILRVTRDMRENTGWAADEYFDMEP